MIKTINKIKNTYIAYDLKNNENVEIIGTSKDMQKYFNLTPLFSRYSTRA